MTVAENQELCPIDRGMQSLKGQPRNLLTAIWGALKRLSLLPWLVIRLRNWPSVLASRCGLARTQVLELRNGCVWHLADLRPGLQVLRDVYLERVYDSPFKLDPGGTILDLGANIGLFTVIAARELVPRGRVIAVEANPYVAAILRKNLANNRISNVELIEAAASTSDGEAELWLAPHSLGASISTKNGKESLVVRTVDISNLVAKLGKIDLLKADVEGAEWGILFDSQPDMWKQIKRVAMEFHLDAGAGRTPDELANQLRKLGYSDVRLQHPPGLYGYVWAQDQKLTEVMATGT